MIDAQDTLPESALRQLIDLPVLDYSNSLITQWVPSLDVEGKSMRLWLL